MNILLLLLNLKLHFVEVVMSKQLLSKFRQQIRQDQIKSMKRVIWLKLEESMNNHSQLEQTINIYPEHQSTQIKRITSSECDNASFNLLLARIIIKIDDRSLENTQDLIKECQFKNETNFCIEKIQTILKQCLSYLNNIKSGVPFEQIWSLIRIQQLIILMEFIMTDNGDEILRNRCIFVLAYFSFQLLPYYMKNEIPMEQIYHLYSLLQFFFYSLTHQTLNMYHRICKDVQASLIQYIYRKITLLDQFQILNNYFIWQKNMIFFQAICKMSVPLDKKEFEQQKIKIVCLFIQVYFKYQCDLDLSQLNQMHVINQIIDFLFRSLAQDIETMKDEAIIYLVRLLSIVLQIINLLIQTSLETKLIDLRMTRNITNFLMYYCINNIDANPKYQSQVLCLIYCYLPIAKRQFIKQLFRYCQIIILSSTQENMKSSIAIKLISIIMKEELFDPLSLQMCYLGNESGYLPKYFWQQIYRYSVQ